MSAVMLAFMMGSAQADATDVSGYIRPAFQATFRPTGVPEDQQNIGMTGSLAGLIFEGSPVEHWSFRTHMRVGADAISVLTGVRTVDTDNDGSVDGVESARSAAIGQILREASVTYSPFTELAIRAGRLPVPFTSQAQASDTALLFSERAGPGRLFQAADDLGALLAVNLDERVSTSLGVFNGDGMGVDASSVRGAMYMGRLDLHPLGSMDFDESRPQDQAFRFGLGGGVIWHAYTVFDSAGYDNIFVGDFRASGSLRVAWAGLSMSTEVLYRLQRDDLTDRPLQATGAFGQLGWRSAVGLEPMFRFGRLIEDETFAPRTTQWVETGMNYYPRQRSEDPNAVRLTLQYTGENRITEQEDAHGVVALIQLVWQ